MITPQSIIPGTVPNGSWSRVLPTNLPRTSRISLYGPLWFVTGVIMATKDQVWLGNLCLAVWSFFNVLRPLLLFFRL